MNNPTAKFTLPRSMIGILVIFGLMGAVLFAARHKDYPNLHIILDTGLFLLSGILALLLWDMGERLNNSFSKHLAVSFAVTAMLNLIHVLVTVEWSGPLLPIAQSANVLRPGTWPPSVHVLPIGVGCSIWLMRRNRHNARTLALVLFALSAGLLVLFNWLPRYLPPGWLGITRPTLILSPMLWAVVGWECWRLRAKDRLLPMLAMMSVVLLLANIVMLYSRAPHDTQAMVAHLCRVCGHLILLVLLMRMASSDMFERIQAEQRLAGLNEELEQRVLDRTRQLESINKSLESEMAVRRQAEVARQASEARYHTLFEYAPDGIVIVDSKGYYLDVNASICRMLGYTRDEFIGLNATDIVAPAEIPHIEQALDVIKNKSDYQREWQFRRKDGSVFSVDTIATAMPDGNLLALIRDITERKQAEAKIHQLNIELEQRVIERTAELEAANKELEAFSYSVSHDLRAPLRAVDGFSQVVEEDYGSQLPKEGQRYLRMIREGAQRMGVLIDDLLTFSRLSRAPVTEHAVNTAKLVHDVMEGLNPQQQGRQIEVRIGDLPACQGDAALLKQVWINLLSNALKYTRHRTPAVIEVGCALEQGENAYFVRDNGAGFDMRYVHKLFGVFQRLHRADEFEGTGVGLAIVQRVIHRHGGRIWAEAAPDRGATFYFTLKGETKP